MAIETVVTEGHREMAWLTLGEALEAALVSMMKDAGDEVAGTRLDAAEMRKGAGTEAPASFREEVITQREKPTDEATQPGKAPASSAHGRGRSAHDKAQPQRRADRPLLYVIEGGGGRRHEGGASAAFRTRAGGGGRGCKLKLVVG